MAEEKKGLIKKFFGISLASILAAILFGPYVAYFMIGAAVALMIVYALRHGYSIGETKWILFVGSIGVFSLIYFSFSASFPSLKLALDERFYSWVKRIEIGVTVAPDEKAKHALEDYVDKSSSKEVKILTEELLKLAKKENLTPLDLGREKEIIQRLYKLSSQDFELREKLRKYVENREHLADLDLFKESHNQKPRENAPEGVNLDSGSPPLPSAPAVKEDVSELTDSDFVGPSVVFVFEETPEIYNLQPDEPVPRFISTPGVTLEPDYIREGLIVPEPEYPVVLKSNPESPRSWKVSLGPRDLKMIRLGIRIIQNHPFSQAKSTDGYFYDGYYFHVDEQGTFSVLLEVLARRKHAVFILSTFFPRQNFAVSHVSDEGANYLRKDILAPQPGFYFFTVTVGYKNIPYTYNQYDKEMSNPNYYKVSLIQR